MTTIAAIFNRDGQPVVPADLATLLAAGRSHTRDGEDCWIDGSAVALAHGHWWVTPEEVGERQPLADPPGRYVISADARLDNRRELIGILGIPAPEGRTLSDAALILQAYIRWGADCPARLLGDFAFAVWDSVERRLTLVRDALGGRGLAYYADPQRFVAATDVEQVLAHPAVSPRINAGKVARFLISASEDEEETFCDPVRHLPPGHCLSVTADSIRTWRYWDIDPEYRIRYRSDGEYAEHFLHLLTEAVGCRLRSVGPVGLALSGGSDSTALAAVAAALLPEMDLPQAQLKSFSYVFDELESCDERTFIRPVVERLGLDATYLPCDDRWTLRDLDQWPVDRDFILWDAYVWLPTAVMQAAALASCRVLMTGHYADALFWDDEYWMLDMLRDWRPREILRHLKRHPPVEGQGRGIGQTVRAFLPNRLRRAYRRLRPRPPPGWQAMLGPELVSQTGSAGNGVVSGSTGSWRSLSQHHHYETLLGDGLLQGRPVARRSFARHGLELVEPFYDRRLVAYAMAVPAYQWGRPGRSKWVLRNALAAKLPPEVVERTSKTDFGALWERGLLDRERATVEALLAEPEIVRRGFVRRDWLAHELAAGQGWTDGGYSLWLCISLELWLRRWW